MRKIDRIILKNVLNLNNLLNTIESSHNIQQIKSNIPGQLIKDQTSKTVLKLELGDSSYFLKIWWDLNLIRFIKNTWRGSFRAYREANGLLLLNKLGLNVPELIVYGLVRQSFKINHNYILTKELMNCSTLGAYLISKQVSNTEIMQKLAYFVFLMHKNDVVHGDFHHDNILVYRNSENIEFYFLDWMGIRKSK
ncbi:lipopolysaccharide kinase InaA family protein, partial [Bacteroidota bacterium]